MKIQIYDPPMCCSTGICGPAVDPALMKISDAILALRKQGVTVERYNLKNDYMAIKDHTLFMDLIHKNGSKILPVTMIHGAIFKTGEYPSYDELCRELGIEPLQSHKPITIHVG